MTDDEGFVQWGAKPKEISNNDYWWGLTEEGDWSPQPLGQQWIATLVTHLSTFPLSYIIWNFLFIIELRHLVHGHYQVTYIYHTRSKNTV